MDIFITWHSRDKIPNIDKLSVDMVNYYKIHTRQILNKYVFSDNMSGLIYISDKSSTEKQSFLQKSGPSICFSAGSPSGLNRLFKNNNYKVDSKNYLVNLKNMFVNMGFALIKDISPPFIFGFIENDSIQVVSDGLGAELAFIYQDDNYWLCSNKCWPIVKFIGKKIEINDLAWKYYFKIGYFPLRLSPFKGVSVLDKGRVWSCRNGISHERKINCIQHWLTPLGLSKIELLEFARNSFNESIKELVDRYANNDLICDLSGGRDTRMILSSILHQGIDCVFKTIGHNDSADRKVSKILQKKYALNVKYKSHDLDKLDEQVLLVKIKKFIQWQDGFGEMKNCKYIAVGPREDTNRPILSGLLGGFYRGYGYPKHEPRYRLIARQLKTHLKRIVTKKPETILLEDELGDKMKPAFQEGKKYGLTGNSLRDYFNFTDNDGRAATPYGGYLIPFLNIGLIKAYFSLDEKERKAGVIHDYVISHNFIGLEKLPYDTDILSNDQNISRLPYDENVFWNSGNGIAIMKKMLNGNHYMWTQLLNRETIFSMWQDHSARKMKHGELFWRIAAFYFWYSEFNRYLNINSSES